MKKISILFFLVLYTVMFSQKQKTKSNRNIADLEPAFNQLLKDWHLAGFAVAVVEKDKIIYSKGFGYRDVEKKLPVDANTLFAIGSCSKAFTDVLIGQLANDKKVDLDQPVTSFFPTLKFYNDNMNNMVTIRDMMSHRTGLPRHDFSWYVFPSASRDSLLKRVQFMEPSATVREKWQYNNFMYMALGAIDEQVTGKTWENEVKQKIFSPLNMTRSNFTIQEWTADQNSSIGYGLKDENTIKKLEYFDISGMSPAGAINSSVNEMANWVMTWINEGKFNGKEIIPSSFRTEAISSQAVVSKGLPSAEKPDLQFATYGFGWTMSSYKGHYRVEHGGNIDGFSASVSFFPTDSLGIVVLTNQDGSRVPSIARNLISDKILGLKYFDWSQDLQKSAAKAKDAEKEKEAKETQPKVAKPTSHDLKDYVGKYQNPGYGTMNIYLENDALCFKGAGKKIRLKHKNYDAFDFVLLDAVGDEVFDDLGLYGQFILDAKGDIDFFSVPFEMGLKPIEFKKQIEEKPASIEELQKYTGDYDLAGISVKVFIKNDKTLYVLVPNQPEYELTKVADDKFALKAISGYFLQFSKDEKGLVKAATFIQPNGNFKAKKK